MLDGFTVAAIGGERVCMFRMHGCPPTLMKFTTFVTISFTRPSSPLFFSFYFLGGRGWPGEEATESKGPKVTPKKT